MKLIIHFIFIILLVSCNAPVPKENKLDKTLEATTIHKLMDEQEASWNNADLHGFMKHYWKSDSLKFIGKRGINYGWQNTLDNYKKSYPTAEEMGKLKFRNLSTEILDDSSAFVIGKWKLQRTSDTLSGHYSLLWKKLNGNWVIVADHSS